MPARLYGLRHRGRLAEGWRLTSSSSTPSGSGSAPSALGTTCPGAPRLYAEADGIEHVLVNGSEVVTEGSFTGSLPGTLLRSGTDTETVTAATGAAMVTGSSS